MAAAGALFALGQPISSEMQSPLPRRRPTRLADYDYATAAAYFVTVCTRHRACVLGEIVAGETRPNAAGRIVEDVLRGLPEHHADVDIDAYVVMPNHLHVIVVLSAERGRAGLRCAPTMRRTIEPTAGVALPEIVRAMKSFSARRINALGGTLGVSVWQRGYYEHVIRDDADLGRIRQYIENNPARWEFDHENPSAIRRDPMPWSDRLHRPYRV